MSRMINGSYIIEPEEPKLCKFCGQIRETRPVGTNNDNICFECAHKPEYIKETTKNLTKLIESSKNVIINKCLICDEKMFKTVGESLRTLPICDSCRMTRKKVKRGNS